MSFFDKLLGKKETDDGLFPTTKTKTEIDPEIRRINSELAREKAAMTRQRMQMDLEKAKVENEIEKIEMQARLERARQSLDDLRQETRGDGGEDSMLDKMLMLLATKAMTSTPTTNAPSVSPAPPATPPLKRYTDEEILNYVKIIPKDKLILAKAMTDDQLGEQILTQVPDADDESVDLAIQKIRSA